MTLKRIVVHAIARACALLIPITMAGSLLNAAQAATSPATSAASKARPPYSATNFPDWNGVWTRTVVRKNPPPRRPGAASGPIGAPTEHPPLTPAYAGQYKVLEDAYAKREYVELPHTEGCRPPGMPMILFNGGSMEMLFTPGQVTMVVETQNEVRHIYTDGRPYPDDPYPTYVGRSLGHWENDTLVIETIAIRPDTIIDLSGLPHSDALKVTEIFKETKPGELLVKVIMDDPKAYTEPFIREVVWRKEPVSAMEEYVCEFIRR